MVLRTTLAGVFATAGLFVSACADTPLHGWESSTSGEEPGSEVASASGSTTQGDDASAAGSNSSTGTTGASSTVGTSTQASSEVGGDLSTEGEAEAEVSGVEAEVGEVEGVSEADVESGDDPDVICPPASGPAYLVTRQAELEALSGCTFVRGNLEIITDPNTEDPIVSLAPLASLREVSGRFFIDQNRALASLEGLGKLQRVGERLRINDNPMLTDLAGMAIAEVGALSIENNGGLQSLAGLENLTAIEDRLAIADNDRLTQLDALANLTSVTNLRLADNLALEDATGLRGLEGSLESLQVIDNASLRKLPAWENIQNVGAGGLEIANLPALTEPPLFSTLQSSHGLYLTHLPRVGPVYSLPKLAHVTQLDVQHNKALHELQLPELRVIDGGLELTHHDWLDTIILPGLVKIRGVVQISNNHRLRTLTLPWDAELAPDIELILHQNSDLHEVTAPPTPVLGGLHVEGLARLMTLEIPGLERITGDLHFASTTPRVVEAVQELAHVEGRLQISLFPFSTEKIGLPKLEDVGGDIWLAGELGAGEFDLPELVNVGGVVQLNHVRDLHTCRLPRLTQTDKFMVLQCPELQTLEVGLSGFSAVGGIYLHGLSNLMGFRLATGGTNELEVLDTPLSLPAAFPELTEVADTLVVKGNSAMTDAEVRAFVQGLSGTPDSVVISDNGR